MLIDIRISRIGLDSSLWKGGWIPLYFYLLRAMEIQSRQRALPSYSRNILEKIWNRGYLRKEAGKTCDS